MVSGAHLGERLAVLRRAAGLTQESLAEQSGVSPDVIRKLDDETAAFELRLRAEASDMGDGVLDGWRRPPMTSRQPIRVPPLVTFSCGYGRIWDTSGS